MSLNPETTLVFQILNFALPFSDLVQDLQVCMDSQKNFQSYRPINDTLQAIFSIQEDIQGVISKKWLECHMDLTSTPLSNIFNAFLRDTQLGYAWHIQSNSKISKYLANSAFGYLASKPKKLRAFQNFKNS